MGVRASSPMELARNLASCDELLHGVLVEDMETAPPALSGGGRSRMMPTSSWVPARVVHWSLGRLKADVPSVAASADSKSTVM